MTGIVCVSVLGIHIAAHLFAATFPNLHAHTFNDDALPFAVQRPVVCVCRYVDDSVVRRLNK